MARRIEIIGFNRDPPEQNSTKIRPYMSERSAERVLDLLGLRYYVTKHIGFYVFQQNFPRRKFLVKYFLSYQTVT